MSSTLTPSVTVVRGRHAGISTLAEDARAGLTMPFKQLPPKHLYDELGSQLFDEICGVPEYYPTRTERAILAANAEAIAELTGAQELVELGAGTAAKTRVLLDALTAQGTPARYVAFDIEEQVVRETTEKLAAEYPQLSAIDGVVGDFEHDLGLLARGNGDGPWLPAPESGPRLLALLGGTLGNFVGDSRRRLLDSCAPLLAPGDHLLLGADLVKDPAVIEAAYNDAAGVTARFNLNLLTILNRELGADFKLDNFEHRAFYDREQEWIEMRLRAREACRVHVRALELEVQFAAGEELRTEISAKFTPGRLESELKGSGLELSQLLTDPNRLFSLALARPADD